ncbi:hypothetical protein ACMYR2_0839 [Nitrobacter sp. TKz-YC01]
MTIHIPLSQVGSAESFVQNVESFWQAKLAHRFTVHMPAPTADPLVESVVRRIQGEPGKPDDFVVLPFEIIDDTPRTPTHAFLPSSSVSASAICVIGPTSMTTSGKATSCPWSKALTMRRI